MVSLRNIESPSKTANDTLIRKFPSIALTNEVHIEMTRIAKISTVSAYHTCPTWFSKLLLQDWSDSCCQSVQCQGCRRVPVASRLDAHDWWLEARTTAGENATFRRSFNFGNFLIVPVPIPMVAQSFIPFSTPTSPSPKFLIRLRDCLKVSSSAETSINFL